MKNFTIETKTIINENIECVVFEDGSWQRIREHEKYGKYFEVANELNTSTGRIGNSFYGRIKDAIEMIRNGNGDCIISNRILNMNIDRVIYIINREIGDPLREKFLESVKDVGFGWCIKYGYRGSSFIKLNKKYGPITINPEASQEEKEPIWFDSEDDARHYIEMIIERSRYYARTLAHNLSKSTNKDYRIKITESIIAEIEEYTHMESSIINSFTFDMIDSDGKLRTPECNLYDMGYEIVQSIISFKGEVN